MSDDLSRWCCARAKLGSEGFAIENLLRQGFDAYYPNVEIERVVRHRVIKQREAVFPGYLLVNVEMTPAAWRAVNGTRGVIRMISFAEDGRPSVIPEGEVEHLRMAELMGKLRVDESPPRRDDRVRVKHGAFVDLEGLVRQSKAERITVLLRLLGGEVAVDIPAHALEIVERAKPSPVR